MIGSLVRYLVIGAVSAAFASIANVNAATIKVIPLKDTGRSLISIEGRLEEADIKAFRQAAFPLDDAIVALNSKGGELKAAIEIGKGIRLKGFVTLVSNAECLSGCALIWLAGERRYMGGSSLVGFHAAYVEDNGLPETHGVGNALIGAYATSLGLSETIVAFVTSAGPDGQVRKLL